MKKILYFFFLVLIASTGHTQNFEKGPKGGFQHQGPPPQIINSHAKLTQLQVTEANTQIDVSIIAPQKPRFSDGAPVAVIITPAQKPSFPGQQDQMELTNLGFIVIQAGYPKYPAFDRGGPNSKQTVKNVLLFAMGKKADVSGKFLKNLVTVPVSPIVGAIGFSHGGNSIITTLEAFPVELKDLSFYVSYESPCASSKDKLGDTVLGDYGTVKYDPDERVDADNDGFAWNDGTNPFYTPDSGIDFSKLKWDPHAKFGREEKNAGPRGKNKDPGRIPPMEDTRLNGTLFIDGNSNGVFDGSLSMDTNQNGKIDQTEDFGFDFHNDQNKRYYSVSVITATKNAQVFGETWPSNIATVDETLAYWQERDMASAFEKMSSTFSHLKVITVSYRRDHVQAEKDYPHIRGQYDGLRKRAALKWVRINPSQAYLKSFVPNFNADSYTEFTTNQDVTATDIWKYTLRIAHKRGQDVLTASAVELTDRIKTKTDGPLTTVLNVP